MAHPALLLTPRRLRFMEYLHLSVQKDDGKHEPSRVLNTEMFSVLREGNFHATSGTSASASSSASLVNAS